YRKSSLFPYTTLFRSLFRRKKHGMDIVALELIRNLQQIDHKNQYFIFVKPDEDDGVIRETANFHIVKIKGGPYPYWEQILLPGRSEEHTSELQSRENL